MADARRPPRLYRFLAEIARRTRRRAAAPTTGTASARDGHTRIHAVLDGTGQAVYLGFRVTEDLDPDGPVNLGHVTALLRATSTDLLDVRGGVAVYVEGQPARWWRLHRAGPGTDPVLTDGVER